MEFLGIIFRLAPIFLYLSSVVNGANPAIFVFGDSIVDVGNNDYLPLSLAKANFPWNGIDFPSGATGRFSNGRNVMDIICDLTGIPRPHPYLEPNTKAGNGIQQGVSYASGAGGILDASGANYIQRLAMNQQISYFQSTLAQLQKQLGVTNATTLLNKALCMVVIGSNDFIDNYLLPGSATSLQYDTQQFNTLLLDTFKEQLTTLYNLGFRKFMVSSVPPLGCIPNQLAIALTSTCVQSTNDQVVDYNKGLQSLLTQLNSNLPGGTFLFANAYDGVNALLLSPAKYGFKVTNQGCCGAGLYNGQVPCLPTSLHCSDRSQYVFWDPFHPTEATDVILGNGLYSGGTAQINPINIKELIDM